MAFAGNPDAMTIRSSRCPQGAPIRRLLLVLPTGGGKTRIFSHMCAAINRHGGQCLVAVHRDFLLRQVNQALATEGCSPNMSRAVMMSAVKRVTEPVRLLVLDEAHHSTAKTWSAAINHLDALAKQHNVPLFVLGVTATPERLDGSGLNDVFDAMIEGPSIQSLIQQGYLTQPHTYAPPDAQINIKGVRKRAGDFEKSQIASRASVITGNVIDTYKRLADGTKAIAFCASVASAQHFQQKFSEAGIPAGCLHGKLAEKERAQLMQDFEAGNIMVLTSCDVVSEGYDVPEATTAILLRPTESLVLYLQQPGRVLRSVPGKTRAIILDHAGNTYRHGLITSARQWSLEGKARSERQNNKASAERGPNIWTCANCFAVCDGANDACHLCGTPKETRTIKTRAGELVLINEHNPPAKRPAKKATSRLTRQQIRELLRGCRTDSELRRRLYKAGYGEGFVRVQLSLRPWLVSAQK